MGDATSCDSVRSTGTCTICRGHFLRTFIVSVIAAAALLLIPAPASTQSANLAPYLKVNFFDLANFAYNPNEPGDPSPHKVANGVPANIKSLDGKKIEVTGVVMPLDFERGKISEFMLAVSADVCGFGAIPRINEWMHVKMAGDRKIPMYATQSYTPLLKVKGILRVQEDVEDGRLIGLYEMVADSAEAIDINQ